MIAMMGPSWAEDPDLFPVGFASPPDSITYGIGGTAALGTAYRNDGMVVVTRPLGQYLDANAGILIEEESQSAFTCDLGLDYPSLAEFDRGDQDLNYWTKRRFAAVVGTDPLASTNGVFEALGIYDEQCLLRFPPDCCLSNWLAIPVYSVSGEGGYSRERKTIGTGRVSLLCLDGGGERDAAERTYYLGMCWPLHIGKGMITGSIGVDWLTTFAAGTYLRGREYHLEIDVNESRNYTIVIIGKRLDGRSDSGAPLAPPLDQDRHAYEAALGLRIAVHQ